MVDVVNPLLASLYSLLTAGLTYNVHEGEEPDDIKDTVYLVMNDVGSRNNGTQSTFDIEGRVQIAINTARPKSNSSLLVNNVANEVFDIIMPTPGYKLPTTAGQTVVWELTDDRSQNYGKLAGIVYKSRILIFSYKIFINS